MSQYIYGLIDPTTSSIRYIGKSRDPHTRLNEHLKEQSDNAKCRWLRKLKSVGAVPVLVVLEEVSDGRDISEVEKLWIDMGFRSGWNLTNEMHSCLSKSNDDISSLAVSVAEWMVANHLGKIVNAMGSMMSDGTPSSGKKAKNYREPNRKTITIADVRDRYGKDFVQKLVSMCIERGGLSGTSVGKVYRDMHDRSMSGTHRAAIREIIISYVNSESET